MHIYVLFCLSCKNTMSDTFYHYVIRYIIYCISVGCLIYVFAYTLCLCVSHGSALT